MRLLRSALLVMTAAVSATGCGNEVGPSVSIFGTYALQTLNGQSVPYVVHVLGNPDGTMTSTRECIGGSFGLNGEFDTWVSSLAYRNTNRETSTGNVTAVGYDTLTDSGTFTTSNGSFQFTRDPGLMPAGFFPSAGEVTGSVSGDTLTIVIPRAQPAVIREHVMVFTK
jgi:hypothetical protein